MENISDKKIDELVKVAKKVRVSVIKALTAAGSGHTAGSLGMADIFTYLYFHALKHDPKNYSDPNRDMLVLSNGHICPVLYSSMAHAGYFSVKEFETSLRKYGSKFQGHPHREFMKEVETSSGPLGEGLSQAVGMAIASRIDTGPAGSRRVYCLLGDGELDEGENWEAAMLAGKMKLSNLIAIVDRNNIQIDGYTEDVMPLEPLGNKWCSFGWRVLEIDGHNYIDIDRAVGEANSQSEMPTVIIAHTIPGRGVSFMERRYEWHGKAPNSEESEKALKELKK